MFLVQKVYDFPDLSTTKSFIIGKAFALNGSM